MTKNYFAENLKFLRVQKKMRQEDLANIVNKARTLIGHWENKTREPTMEDVLNLSDFFEIP